MAYDVADREIVFFGGSPWGNLLARGETWTYAGGVWTNLTPKLAVSPPVRISAAMTYDAGDGYVLLFGGDYCAQNWPHSCNDTWAFSDGGWTQIHPLLSPGRRLAHTMTYDARDGYVVLFGGVLSSYVTGPNAFLRETWAYRGGNWTNLTSKVNQAPPAEVSGTLSYDATAGDAMLYGGNTNQETWVYSNLTWTKLSPKNSPPPLNQTQMAYVPRVSGIILTGGYNLDALGYLHFFNGTWIFRNGSWSNLSAQFPDSPGYRTDSVLCWDGADNLAMLWGGEVTPPSGSQRSLNDTWSFGGPLLASLGSSLGVEDLGQVSSLTARAASKLYPLTYNYSGLPPGCAGQNVSTILCRPNSTGEFLVNLTVTDPTGFSVVANTSFRVNSPLTLDDFSAIPAVVDVGSIVTFTVNATGGTYPFLFNYSGLPTGCPNINQTALNCRPTSSGSFNVSVQITDGAGVTKEAWLMVTVHEPFQTGPIAVLPAIIDKGQLVTLYANLSGGTTPYSIGFAGLPAGCVQPAVFNGSFSCKPLVTGFFNISVAATDATGVAVNANATLAILPQMVASVVGMNSLSTDVGIAAHFTLSATGGLSPYFYPAGSLPAGCQGIFPSLRCTPSEPGDSTLNVTIEDETHAKTWILLALRVAPLPIIVTATAMPASTDVGVRVAISTTATGGTGWLNYTYSSLPPGCAPQNSSKVECVPNAASSTFATVVVTDAVGGAAHSLLTIHVNHPPMLSVVGGLSQHASVGKQLNISSILTGGTAPFTFDYSGLPPGCTSVNVSTLNCIPTNTGTYRVAVLATDGVGVNSFANLTLVISQGYGGGGPFSSLASWLIPAAIGLFVLVGGTVAYLLVARHRRQAPQ